MHKCLLIIGKGLYLFPIKSKHQKFPASLVKIRNKKINQYFRLANKIIFSFMLVFLIATTRIVIGETSCNLIF